MRKKRIYSGISLLMAAALTACSITVMQPVPAEAAGGTTYYIDPNGDNSKDGKSKENAWADFENVKTLQLTAGDQVLLKAGAVWNEKKLMIEGAKGTADSPVILGKYGEGADPIINGNGNPWNDEISTSSLKKEDVAVVHVKNSEYITIQNLEVTNWESDAKDLMSDSTPKYKQSKSMLTGILVENRDAGNLNGVVIQNNYVHDVNGYMSQNGSEGHKKGSGGIMALVTGGGETGTESYFTDLKILGNKVERVCHEAIYMESCWAARTLVGGAGSQQAGKYKWVGWPKVYVADNWVNDVAGDGIVLINADGGIAERNLVTKSASEEWNFSRNPAHAAIWMWDCNNVTMQYNEAAYTTSTGDGMAFDCDYGNQNVMYQYNYSHNNKGGFWMSCPGPYYTVNAVVRYNISANDAGFDGGRIIRVGEKGSIGNQVYNNSIYWDTDYEVAVVEQGSWGAPPSSGTDIYNNIFYGKKGTFLDNAGTTYSSNCVWGGIKDSYLEVVDDAEAIIADPMFTDTAFGTGYTDGSFQDGKVTLGSAAGFKLKAESPCIDAGIAHKAVPEASFDAVKSELVPTHITLEGKDYEGNAVPYPQGNIDIGAYEYQGKGTITETVVDKTYIQALINQAKGYQKDQFEEASYVPLEASVAKAEELLKRTNLSQEQIESYAVRLENAMLALKRKNQEGSGTPAPVIENVMESYKTDDTYDNAGFEKANFDWGYWEAKREISTEQKHSGNQSLKITKDAGKGTGYSEIGKVPIEPNTDYICEAWIYSGDADASTVGMEAKHHNSYAGKDIKLGFANAVDVTGETWKKIKLEFKTQGYEWISLAASVTGDVAYLDDVTLYKKDAQPAGDGKTVDRSGIKAVLEKIPSQKEEAYTPSSWKNYKTVVQNAKLKYVDPFALQTALDAEIINVENALNALLERANRIVLSALYEAYSTEEQGKNPLEAWGKFQKALTDAKAILDNHDATQAQADEALTALVDAKGALQYETLRKGDQVITVASEMINKKCGDKPFSLGAKLTEGNGTLQFKSSNSKVADVSRKGKVTIKAAGLCKITVTAPATDKYSAKSEEIVIKAAPGAMTVKNTKSAAGRKLTVSFSPQSSVTGYEIQYSTSADFKSPKTVPVKKASASSAVITKLTAGKKYYVRIRAYKSAQDDATQKKIKINGPWSKSKVSAPIKK